MPQADEFNQSTPYSRENFLKLLEITPAKASMTIEDHRMIQDALNQNDEKLLQKTFEILLEEYAEEDQINKNFTETKEKAVNRFKEISREEGQNLKNKKNKITAKYEEHEHEEADKILDQINNTKNGKH